MENGLIKESPHLQGVCARIRAGLGMVSSKGLSSGFQVANDYCIFLSEWEYLLQFTIIYINGRSEVVITCLFKSLIIRQSGTTFKLDEKDCTLPGNPGLFEGYSPESDSELTAMGELSGYVYEEE